MVYEDVIVLRWILYSKRDFFNVYIFNVENVRDIRKCECKERGKMWIKEFYVSVYLWF